MTEVQAILELRDAVNAASFWICVWLAIITFFK